MPSRTREALKLLEENPDLTPYAAAKEVGISPSTVYHALAHERDVERCPTCGQVVAHKGDTSPKSEKGRIRSPKLPTSMESPD